MKFALALICLSVQARTITVARDGSAQYVSVQRGIDAAAAGDTISIAPGTYREIVTVAKPGLTLRGSGARPHDTVIVYDLGTSSMGNTFRSATVEVLADGFHGENLTFANDFNTTHAGQPQSQALALLVNADRSVFRNMRFLGNQDTVYAASRNCNPEGNPCFLARQYFADCYIEGNVDFIFGDGKAVFDRCEIHSRAPNGGYITAQGKHYDDEDSGFVFNRAKLTAEPGVSGVWLGRPWRGSATVVFLHTEMGAHIAPAGWREWQPGRTSYLDSVYYAEYDSSGPGARAAARDPHTKHLREPEAARFEPKKFLSGADQWDPER